MAMYVWIGCDAFCVVVSCYATGFFIFHIREKRAAESVGKRDTQKKKYIQKNLWRRVTETKQNAVYTV